MTWTIRRAAVISLALLVAIGHCGDALAQQRPAEIEALNREIARLLNAYKLFEAAAVADRLVTLARERGGERSILYADALGRAAEVRFTQQRYLEALPLYERAFQIRESVLGPNHPNLVRPLNDLATAYGKAERMSEALSLVKRALAMEEGRLGAGHPGIVPLLLNLANMQSQLTADPLRVEEAERLYRRALSILGRSPSTDNNEEALSAMVDLATIYQSARRYEEAEKLLQQVVAIHRNRRDELRSIWTMEKLAQLYSHQGATNKAIPIREHILERQVKLSLDSGLHGIILLHLGMNYADQGRYDEAAALQERSLAVLQRRLGPEAIELGTVLQNLGLVHYFSGRLPQAEQHLRRAIAIGARSTGNESSEFASLLRNLVPVLRDQGRLDEARALAERSLAIEEKARGSDAFGVGASVAMLASVSAAQRRDLEAKALYQKATTIMDATVGRNSLHTSTTIRELAVVECALGEFDASLSHAREAASFLSQRGERTGAREAGAGLAYTRGAFPTQVCAAYGAARERPREREVLASEALVAAQRDRRSLAEAALAQMAARASVGNAALAEAVRKQQDLSSRLRALDQQHIEALSQPTAAKAEADRIRAIRTQVERQLGEAITGVEKANPDFAALTNPQPIDIGQARAHLRDDEALVVHMVTETATYVWAISRTELAWERIPLGTAALARQVAVFRRPLDDWAKAPRGLERLSAESTGCAPAAADPRGLARTDAACTDDRRFSLARSHELYAALLGPVETVIKGKRHLILVPSGPLTGLPFSALITEKPADTSGNSKSFAAAPWLVRRHATTVLPSVASLALLRQQVKASRATRSFVGIGNPDFSGGPPVATGRPERAGARTAANAPAIPSIQVAEARGFSGYFRGGRADLATLKQSLSPLPDTADELRAIATTLGAADSDLLLARDATERRVRALSAQGRLAQYRVVAFATHGLVAGEAMGLAEPAIALSLPQAASDEDDGLLTASEAAQLKLDADWVVLSACNTAAGNTPGAEALSGLARAFFYAGARALLVSNWPVASPAAVKLTTRSFAALDKEPAIGRAEALRRAMLSLIEGGTAHEAHPAYWAPFVVVGEGAAAR